MKRIIALLLACCVLCAASGCSGQTVPEPEETDTRVYSMPEDHNRVFYQIMVGSYRDSDGDGIGDLRGIIDSLDYINDGDPSSKDSLHAGGIWLTPIMPSPTYHKYDTTDYYDIDPDFGTLDDFRELVSECDKRGIAVVLDLSVNHSSDEHPWFRSACASLAAESCGEEECANDTPCIEHNPYLRYYNFNQTGGGSYHIVSGTEGWFYEGEYHAGMPDLNLSGEEVNEEIRNICSFWLDMGVYGFRLDSLKSYFRGDLDASAQFVGALKKDLDAKYGDVYLVGELWDNNRNHLQTYYETSGITSLFVFDLSIQSGNSMTMDMRMGRGSRVSDNIKLWNDLVPDGSVNAYFLSNHDMTRSAGSANRDIVLEKQAAAIYLLLPGSSYIYYGEEIGMAGGSDNDPNKRMPMIWSAQSTEGMASPPEGATSKETLEMGVSEQLVEESSLLNFYIEALKIRNSCPALVYGAMEELPNDIKELCAYQVEYQDSVVQVYHNCGAEAVSLECSGTILESLAAGGEHPSVENDRLTLPPYSTAIISVS